MIRYISVDSGKFATKVTEYDPKGKKIIRFPIRTRVSDGDMRDDAIEKQTVVIEVDGKTYKVGNGARGTGAALETDKATDVHKICTLTAIATLASRNETDEIHVAVGLPAKEWANVSKRMDFKDYILPKGECKVTIKRDSLSAPVEKTFVIKSRYVYPESIGALFMDQTIANITPTTITGVLDIGNLNLNATLWQGTELLQDKSLTAELGGAILIQELSQEITTNIAACDELITANILKSDDKCIPNNGNLTDEQVAASRELINRVLKAHAEKIKRCCQARNWSLDVTNIVAIGGTSADLKDELKEVFGDSITILDDSAYCNSMGYLRMMCAREDELGEIIPLVVKDAK